MPALCATRRHRHGGPPRSFVALLAAFALAGLPDVAEARKPARNDKKAAKKADDEKKAEAPKLEEKPEEKPAPEAKPADEQPAEAAPKPDRLTSVRESIDMLEHDAALEQLKKILADPAATPLEKAQAHWLSAVCYQAVPRKKEMGQEIDELLLLWPLFQPKGDAWAPELIKLYDQKAQQYREEHLVSLGEPAVDNAKVAVAIEKNKEEVAGARVLARAKGETEFQFFPLTVADGKVTGELATAELLKKAEAAGGIEYVVQTLTKGGLPNGQTSEEAAPRFAELKLAKAATSGATATGKTDEPARDKTFAAIGVGSPMLALGVLASIVALALTAAAGGLFLIGVLQLRGSGPALEPRMWDALRISQNTASVLGPSLGVAGVLLTAFGLAVVLLLR